MKWTLLIVFVLGLFFLLYSHESAHSRILDYYGIDNEIDFVNLKTIAYGDCSGDCLFLNGLIDIIDFYLIPLYIIIGFVLLIKVFEDEL